MIPTELAGGIALGWAIGNSDSANVFGTAVASHSIRFAPALLLCAAFILLGGITGGQNGIATLSSLTSQSLETALIASLASAFAIIVISALGFTASASHSMVGAIIGIGVARTGLDPAGLEKIGLSWVATPVAGCVAAIVLFRLIALLVNRLPVNIFTLDKLVRASLVAASCYAAYALGANNVANATGVYAAAGALTPLSAALAGGASMALGTVTTGRRLFTLKVQRVIKLDPATALVAVLAEAVTVHVFALIGVPVSTGQALTGALFGIGLLKGMQTIKFQSFFMILASWILTPLMAGIASYSLVHLFRLI